MRMTSRWQNKKHETRNKFKIILTLFSFFRLWKQSHFYKNYYRLINKDSTSSFQWHLFNSFISLNRMAIKTVIACTCNISIRSESVTKSTICTYQQLIILDEYVTILAHATKWYEIKNRCLCRAHEEPWIIGMFFHKMYKCMILWKDGIACIEYTLMLEEK